jgi:hypothetical protein
MNKLTNIITVLLIVFSTSIIAQGKSGDRGQGKGKQEKEQVQKGKAEKGEKAEKADKDKDAK